jgi:hypothetical protein
MLTAAFSLFVGVLLLWHPVEGAVSLTLVLISFFIAEGKFQVAAAIRYREAFPDSWGWLLMNVDIYKKLIAAQPMLDGRHSTWQAIRLSRLSEPADSDDQVQFINTSSAFSRRPTWPRANCRSEYS